MNSEIGVSISEEWYMGTFYRTVSWGDKDG